MSNSSVVFLDANPRLDSVGLYLHWNGGAESILAFAEAAALLQIPDPHRPSYERARFTQMVGNFFGGRLSLGLDVASQLCCEHNDHGVFVIQWEPGTLAVSLKQDSAGRYPWKFKTLNLDPIRRHPYLAGKADDPETLIDVIVSKNEHAQFIEKRQATAV